VLALATIVAAMAVPLTARSVDAVRARNAAAFVATHVRLARQRAIATARATALVFDAGPLGWNVRVCQDTNGNGVRRADIVANRDGCPEGPWALGTLFPTMRVDVAPDIPGVDGESPSADPVRFGRGDMMSCSTSGGCSPGTLFLRAPDGTQYAVRVGGVTGRTRVLRFDRATWRWVSG
jgi:hypothetical protein